MCSQCFSSSPKCLYYKNDIFHLDENQNFDLPAFNAVTVTSRPLRSIYFTDQIAHIYTLLYEVYISARINKSNIAVSRNQTIDDNAFVSEEILISENVTFASQHLLKRRLQFSKLLKIDNISFNRKRSSFMFLTFVLF